MTRTSLTPSEPVVYKSLCQSCCWQIHPHMLTGYCVWGEGCRCENCGHSAVSPMSALALIEAGTFCGKPATAHVYLNPANMAKLLPGSTQSPEVAS